MVLDIARSAPNPVIPAPRVTWECLPDDFVLPDDPVENIQQPALAAALTDALGAADLIRPEMLIAPNFALVATVNGKTVVKAPDWLMVPQVNPVAAGVIRRSYTPQLEGDPVAIVMEFLSDDEAGELSVRSTYPYGKLYFYEQILCIPTYVTFDPYTVTLEVRQLTNGQYVHQKPNATGHFWIPEVNLWLGIWPGARLNMPAHWLRWWDIQGTLLPWASEQVDAVQQQLVAEKQRAETEKQRAETEKQRAETEKQRADDAVQKASLLAAKLRDLGIDPEQL
jgi:Uma2 family endonuclease